MDHGIFRNVVKSPVSARFRNRFLGGEPAAISGIEDIELAAPARVSDLAVHERRNAPSSGFPFRPAFRDYRPRFRFLPRRLVNHDTVRGILKIIERRFTVSS